MSSNQQEAIPIRPTLHEVVAEAQRLSPEERGRLVAWLMPRLPEGEWEVVKLSDQLTVVAYQPSQEQHLDAVRSLAQHGVLARRDPEDESYYELYGPDRTYYVTLDPRLGKEFIAVLQSWPIDHPPRVVDLDGWNESSAG